MDEILIRQIPLPYSIGGMTAMDENGDYNVYINDRLSEDKKRKAYNHELSHIRKNHFGDDRSVKEKEDEVDVESTEVKIRKLEHSGL